ncbi:MAG: AraC family transcriptional regulator [Thermonemataceae bacterium]
MIEKILEYIALNFQRSLSLKKLANNANYSSFHFQRVFKATTGETPKAYITRLRVQKACKELLLFPNKTIYSIAVDCGFNSSSDFSRTFKRITGQTPTAFRSQELKKESSLWKIDNTNIETKWCSSLKLIGNIVIINDEERLIESFKALITWANARELLQKDFLTYGVFLDSPYLTSLDKCRYFTAIQVKDSSNYPEKFFLKIGQGKFGTLKVKSTIPAMIEQSLFLKKYWVPHHGFTIKENELGFEVFNHIDLNKPYSLQARTLYLPIQPK